MEEKPQILKGTGNPLFSNGIGGEPQKALPFKRYFSAVRPVHAGNTVEERRFAGSIRSDHRQDFFGFDAEIYILQGADTSETNREPLGLQYIHILKIGAGKQ